MKNRTPLRRKITYIGLAVSLIVGIKIWMLGYLGPIFGLFIVIAGPLVSYLIGTIAEEVMSK